MKKYLILIPLIIGVICLQFFSAAYTQVRIERYEQKFSDVQDSIALVAMNIASLSRENVLCYESHKRTIQNQMTLIDEGYMVYAALFTEDLELISKRITWNEAPFDPFDFLEFREAIMESERGIFTFPYDDGIHKYDEMSVYFRWVYTNDGDEKYLLTAGVSLYSPIDNFAVWVIYGTLSIVGTLVILQIWMVVKTLKLSETEKKLQKKIKECEEKLKECEKNDS